MLVRIGIAAKMQGVSTSTMRRWEKEERLVPERRTRGGHRRYKLALMVEKEEEGESKKNAREVVGYARVSAAKQRKELVRQQEHIQRFADQQGWKIKKVFTDIASGMNEGRKGLNKLLYEVATTHPFAILCTYKDRLARFGTKVIEHYCKTFETKIISIYQQQPSSHEDKLVENMIALVTSFAGRLHRQRRGKATPNKKITGFK